MSVFRDFEHFKEEIELAIIQNACVEVELYSVVASMIRESENKCKISLRDVSSRRKTKISEVYYGASGFPDFVVLERKKMANARQYGCVEIKMPTVPLETQGPQIQGHIQSFDKVLYSNGIRWIFLEKNKVLFDITLGNIQGESILWNSKDAWDALLEEIDSIKWD